MVIPKLPSAFLGQTAAVGNVLPSTILLTGSNFLEFSFVDFMSADQVKVN